MAAEFPLIVLLEAVDKVTGPLGKVEGSLGHFGEHTKEVGEKFNKYITAPILAAGAGAIFVGTKIDDAMRDIRVRAGATTEDVKNLREEIERLSDPEHSAAGPREIATAMATLADEGFEVASIMTETGTAIEFVEANALDTKEGVLDLTKTLHAYQLEADQSAHVSDVFTRSLERSSGTVADHVDALVGMAPIAAENRLEFEEMAATAAILGDRQIRGAAAVSVMKKALATITNPGEAAIKVFDRLKIRREELLDGENRIRSIAQLLDVLQQHGAKTSDVLDLFGNKAGPGFARLLSAGGDAVRELTGDLKHSLGASLEAAEIRMGGTTGALHRFEGQLENLGEAVADTGLLEWFTKFVRHQAAWLRKFSETNPELLKWGVIIGGVAAAIGPLLVVLGSTVVLLGAIAPLVAAIVSPVGLVVAGVAALTGAAVLLVTHWDEVKIGLEYVYYWIRGKVGPAFSWLGSVVLAVMGRPIDLAVKGVGLLIDSWDELILGFETAYDWISGKLGGALEWLAGQAASILPEWLGGSPSGAPGGPSRARAGSLAPTSGALAPPLGAQGGVAGSLGANLSPAGFERRSRVEVDFRNVPRGTLVRQDDRDVNVDLSLGVSLASH